MSVVRLTIAYDGTDFHGWAGQPRLRTVEGTLAEVLARALGSEPKLSVAGRTDAGVHARGQVVSFPADAQADPERLQRVVNRVLAPEVVVLHARRVPDGFDARFSATAREYRYRIETGALPDPFTARYVWHRPGKLAIAPMRASARSLEGEHDFASFCRRPEAGGTVRNLRGLSVSRSGGRIEITARADSFLHQMVRSLVGSLVAVGRGKLDADAIPAVLLAHDRSAAGPLAPARGLTLERVVYGHRP